MFISCTCAMGTNRFLSRYRYAQLSTSVKIYAFEKPLDLNVDVKTYFVFIYYRHHRVCVGHMLIQLRLIQLAHVNVPNK